MNVLSYLKDLYTKENSIFNHISLFALVGICTISTVAYLSTVLGNIYGSFFDFAPTTKINAYFLLVLGLMTIFFFCGYIYSFANKVFQDKTNLPELSLSSYSAFVRTLPIVISWYIYEVFLVLIGFAAIPATTRLFYVYYSVLICLLPFINLIVIGFSKDFKYHPDLFSFLTLFKVLNHSLGAIINLAFQMLLLIILPVGIVNLMFKYGAGISHQTLKVSVKLISLCVTAYFIMIAKLVYTRGLVEIVKEKLSNI